jgi:hypothetical protein
VVSATPRSMPFKITKRDEASKSRRGATIDEALP